MVPNKPGAGKNNSGLYLKGVLCILGGLTAAASSFCFFAWLLSRTNLPLYMAVPFSTVSICVGTFFCAFLLCRSLALSPLLTGLMAGGGAFGVFMVSACLEGIPEITGITPLRLAALLASGLLGALAAQKKKKKRIR